MLKNITAVSLLLVSTALIAETLDEAIKRFVPTATDSTINVAPTEEILIQAKAAVKAAQQVAPSDELDRIAELLDTLIAGELLSEEDREELISLLVAFANANSAVYGSVEQHKLINGVVQQTIKALPAKLELMAFPMQVSQGGYSNLMWVSTHKNCQVAGQSVAAAGSMRVGPLSGSRQFSLDCSNDQGQKSTKTILIKVTRPKPKPEPKPKPVVVEPPTTAQKPSSSPLSIEYPVGVLRVVSATASGFQRLSNGEAYTASNAIDGNLGTRWTKSGIDTDAKRFEWIKLDLGEERRLDRLRISFYKYNKGRIYDYDIAVSKDNKSWKTIVKNAKSAATKWTTQSFKPVLGQYVKVIINSASDNSRWANLYEIEVLNLEGRVISKKVTLKWAASNEDIDGYKVFFGTTKESVGDTRITILHNNGQDYDKLSPSVTFDSVDDLGLIDGDRVCFSLKAVGGSGASEMSKVICGVL